MWRIFCGCVEISLNASDEGGRGDGHDVSMDDDFLG